MCFPDIESDIKHFYHFYAYTITKVRKCRYDLKCSLTGDIILSDVTRFKIRKWFLDNYVTPKIDDSDKLIMIK